MNIDIDLLQDALEEEGFDNLFSFDDLRVLTDRYEILSLLAQQNLNGHVDPKTVGELLKNVQPEEVDWLWYGRIARGKLTIIDGDPGNGKSVLTMDMASRQTTGKGWPDGEPCDPAGVVILNAEDGLADTVRPRIDAAGGNPALMVAIDGVGEDKHPVTLPADIPYIEAAIKRVLAALVIIDPLMAFLSGDIQSHRDQDVRRVLRQLRDLAERTGAAIVVVRHLNKTSGGPVLYRGGGSIGIIGAARVGLVVGVDPEDEQRHILAATKANLTVKPDSLAYRLVTAPNGSVLVEWEGVSDMSADQLLAAPQSEDESTKSLTEEVMRVLLGTLADGSMDSKLAMKIVHEATGASERTIQRARTRAKIKTERMGFGKDATWVWTAP